MSHCHPLPTKLKRPKRQNSQAKLASAAKLTPGEEQSQGSPSSQTKVAKTSSAQLLQQQQQNGGGQLRQQSSQQSDSTTSSSSASSAYSAVCRSEQHPLLLHSSGSSICVTPNELLLQQSLQLLGQHSSAAASHPLSLASLHYGPFGIPSFASPQGHSLVHFQPQLQQQQQQAFDKSSANLAAAAALQLGGMNQGLLATQNAYEGLPIFVVPHASALSLNALQRAAEFKAMSMNALLQQQNQVQPSKPDTSKHFHVFVGDLSQDVDNQLLKEVFSKFGEVSEAKVMRDPQSSKSRSFGFVAFPKKEDAQRAIDGMNGEVVGRRPIRTGWAVRRSSVATSGAGQSGSEEERSDPSVNFECVYNSTDADNTTIYLGGLSTMTTEEPIRAAFGQFGPVKEVRLFAAQNFGFVVFGEKAQATRAIMEMHGRELDLGIVAGKCRLRVKWGKPVQHGGAGGSQGGGGGAGNMEGTGNGTGSANLQLSNSALIALNQNSALLGQQQQQNQQLALAAAAAMAAQAQAVQSCMAQPMLAQQFLSAGAHFAQPQIGSAPSFCGGWNQPI